MRLFPKLGWLLVGMVGACSHGDPALKVNQFHLREVAAERAEDPFLRGEEQRRLYGAVSMAERQMRLGQYYSISWRNPEVGAPVRVVFEYRQASTGPQVLSRSVEFPAGAKSGHCEFAVIGKDYAEHGRVLAWQVTVWRGERPVAQRRSFMWQ